MTGKERVIAALKHQEPDQVPTGENAVDYELVEEALGRPTLYNARWKELEALWQGRREEIAADYKRDHVALARKFEWDYVRVPVVPAKREHRMPEMLAPYTWRDEEGRMVRYFPDSGSVVEPLPKEDMAIAELPDPDGPYAVDHSQLEAVEHVVRELGRTHFIIGRLPLDGTFPWGETVGMNEFLVRMVTEPEFVRRAIVGHSNRSLAWIRAMLGAGCNAVMPTNDYSDNRGPIMGPERFRTFILPALKKQVETTHAMGGYFIKHTDGNTWSILDMFLEAGVDGWHGIQPSIGMDLKLLKEKYGGRLCFFGGVNCETLIAGRPQDVRAEVRYAIKHAAPGGGLVVTCGNVVQAGARLENYLAERQAVQDFGRYPIRL